MSENSVDRILPAKDAAEQGRDEELQRNHTAESTPTPGRGFRTLRVLGFQMHTGPPFRIQFRNVRYRKL